MSHEFEVMELVSNPWSQFAAGALLRIAGGQIVKQCSIFVRGYEKFKSRGAGTFEGYTEILAAVQESTKQAEEEYNSKNSFGLLCLDLGITAVSLMLSMPFGIGYGAFGVASDIVAWRGGRGRD